MRKRYTDVLKTFFREQLFIRRKELGISQEEMAHRLAMASRTYVDLEHGKAGSSALTLVLFLIYICDDPLTFLKELQKRLESGSGKAE